MKEALRSVFAAFLEADPSDVVVFAYALFQQIETSQRNEGVSCNKNREVIYRGMGGKVDYTGGFLFIALYIVSYRFWSLCPFPSESTSVEAW